MERSKRIIISSYHHVSKCDRRFTDKPVEKQVEVEVKVEVEVEVVGVEGRPGCFSLCSSGSGSCQDSDSSFLSHAAFTWTPSLAQLLLLLLLLTSREIS